MNYSTEKPLLSLENISLKYGDKVILRDINIQLMDLVRPGEVTGQVCTIVGKSGVGKSQLFKLIAGLQPPTTGTIRIGLDQRSTAPGLVGMVSQNYPLFNHHSVQGNLELVTKDVERINFYLSEFNLTEHKDKYPCQLSGGQRQRAAIIQQILCSEHFILLDEPFSGLDPLATQKLCEIIVKIASMDELNTILISSHVLEPSMAVSDHVWVLGNQVAEFPARSDMPYLLGATIAYTEDLAAQGLAWRKDIHTDPAFVTVCQKVRDSFKFI